MRRIKRSMLRAYAERKGIKPSSFVAETWDKYQIRKLGWAVRRANQRHGTRPKRKWRAA